MSIEQTHLDIVDDFQSPNDEEIERVIAYVFAHRKEAIRAFLREQALPVSGAKLALRNRIGEALDQGRFTVTALIELLDTIEGWGNQHIYLYDAPPGELQVWKSESQVRQRLEKVGYLNLFNRRRPLILPQDPTLSSIEWSPHRVRLVWVEQRKWEIRLSESDYEEDGTHYKAYEEQIARGITTFDWDLVSGQAALMIQRLPSGERYHEVKQHYEQQLEAFLHIGNFTPIAIRHSIHNIENSGEARKRQIAHETQRGSRVTYTSRSRQTDAFADPDLKKSRQALGRQTASVLGNFYWQPEPPHLDRTIHIKLYANDQRVGIFGECKEGEVKYVLSRIRHHSL